MAPITLLQRNCNPTEIELQRPVSGAGACHSVLGGGQGPPSGSGPYSAPPVEYADFSLATLNTPSSCTCRGFAEAGFAIQTLAKKHTRVNAESARWIGHLIQRAQTHRHHCIGMQQCQKYPEFIRSLDEHRDFLIYPGALDRSETGRTQAQPRLFMTSMKSHWFRGTLTHNQTVYVVLTGIS